MKIQAKEYKSVQLRNLDYGHTFKRNNCEGVYMRCKSDTILLKTQGCQFVVCLDDGMIFEMASGHLVQLVEIEAKEV